MVNKYKKTLRACYIGYFTQAIINNLAPVFFVIFQQDFDISLTQISWLIFINFGVQIVTDLVSVYAVDKIGYRKSVVLAHIASVLGLVLLGVLPYFVPNPFWGMAIAIVIYAYGSGLIEVLVSPIVDSIPSDNKSSAMSLLHSFYCWGQLGVVLLSTLALRIIGDGYWFILPILWAIVPAVNIFNFSKAPLAPMVAEEEKTPVRQLLTSKTFIVLLVMMLCAGATEMTISQWSSLFAERGLGDQGCGRFAGTVPFCIFYGNGKSHLRCFRESNEFKAKPSGVLGFGDCLLSFNRTFTLADFGACGVCAYGACRKPFVAGIFLFGLCLLSERRNGAF